MSCEGDRMGLGKTMNYPDMRDGSFPQPFNPGGAGKR
jgi:hypothetical protein